MKKIILAALLVPAIALAQTYPSPTFNSVILQTPLSVANGGTGATTATGTGSAVLSNSPALTMPNLGTPSFATLTNATGLPISTGVSGLGAGVATALGSAVTGSGGVVLAASPTISNPTITGPLSTSTAVTGTNSSQVATTAFVANHSPCPSILDFGGDATGTNNNDTAWSNLVAAQSSARICAYFPVGTFKFASVISATLPNSIASITIEGAGNSLTELYWPTASNGITLSAQSQLNSFHIRDVTITTGSAPASGNAVTLNQSATLGSSNNATEQSDFTNVDIRGHDGPNQTDYWSTGVYVNGWSVINFVNFKIDGQFTTIVSGGYVTTGVGVNIAGSSSIIPVQYNFTNANFTYVGTGLVYGNYVQGVTISQSNFTGGNVGIQAGGSEIQLAQLSVTASQFNVLAYAIFTATPIGNLLVYGNNFYCPKNNCASIFLQSTEGFQIVGNFFNGAGSSVASSNGIVIGSNPNSFPGVISGNSFINFSGASAIAVALQAASSKTNVQSNGYANNTIGVSNSGTGNTVGGGSQ